MKRAYLCVSFWVFLVSAPSAFSQSGVSAHAWVDSVDYRIGDPIPLHVQVTHPRGTLFLPAPGDSAGPFAILRRDSLKAEGDTLSAGTFVLAYYDSGTVAIPPVQLQYRVPGDTMVGLVETNPVTVTVHAIAVDTTKEYRDLKPPLPVPMSWLEILLYAAVVLAVLGLPVLAYIWYRTVWKRRRKKGEAGEPVPVRPADLIALDELHALKAKGLWQKGLVKEYYTEITDILRRYFERRYAVRALEETTDEILGSLRGTGMTADVLGSADRLLRRSDLVKFAKYMPGIPDHEESLAAAYDIVEQTKPVPVSEPAASQTELSANVGS